MLSQVPKYKEITKPTDNPVEIPRPANPFWDQLSGQGYPFKEWVFKLRAMNQMAISIDQLADGSNVVIKVTGRFDFSCHQEFSEIFKIYQPVEKGYVVDLSETDYMDSSALGMLLQLREHADKSSGVSLINGSEGVTEMLRVANFDKLFIIGELPNPV